MYERISKKLELHYSAEFLDCLTDEELAKRIKESDIWDDDLVRELCYRADTLKEFVNAETEEVEAIIYKSAKILGVDII